MKRILKRCFAGAFAGLLCLCGLAACGPNPASTVTGTQSIQIEHAASPVASGGTLHLTWLSGGEDPEGVQRRLGALQTRLRLGDWSVQLDVLPAQYIDDPSGYATDAFVATPADAEQLYKKGITGDAVQLCRQYAPVLADKYADLLQDSGIPLGVSRYNGGLRTLLYLRRDKAPPQWLKEPPALSDVVAWVENGNGRIGRAVFGTAEPQPLWTPVQAWAAEQGYYSLDDLQVFGGLFAAVDDAKLQPVPLERIKGFDAMYKRLVVLFLAGKLFDTADIDGTTDGYLESGTVGAGSVDESFLKANGLTGSDIVGLPLRGTDLRPAPPSTKVQLVMAIPKGSRYPELMLQLAQWALTTREGYDLINCGVQGRDYELVGDRIRIIAGGNDDVPEPFARDGAFDRISVDEPFNAADLRVGGTAVLLPYVNNAKVQQEMFHAQGALYEAMMAITDANMDFITARDNLLMGRMPGAYRQATEQVTDAERALRLLHDKPEQTDELCRAYGEELAKLSGN